MEATNNGKTRSRGSVRWRSPSRRAPARRPALQGHPRDRVPPAPRLRPSSTADGRTPGRRRRRSSATLGCGMCRPPRCCRTVSGRSAAIAAAPTTSRATPTSPTSPARSPSASRTAPRSSARSWSTRASTATSGRSSSTIPTFGGIVDRYPQVNQTWTGDNIGDLYLGAKVNLWSECRQNPVAHGRARHRQSCRPARPTPASAPAKPDFVGRLHRQQGSGEAGRSLRVRRLRVARQARTASTRPSGAFRWGTGAAFPSRSSAARRRRAERQRAVERARRRSRRHALVGIDGSVAAAGRRTPRTSRARRRPHVAGEERASSSAPA